MCPDYWTILDPLIDNYTPDHNMITNVTRAMTTTYQHHHEQCPPLPRYRKVNRIAIQSDAPIPSWSCGTVAILTLLHLTLGSIRPDLIATNSITCHQMLSLHEAILRWLIIGTPPDLWQLQCLNSNIIQISPIEIPLNLTRCALLQTPSLPRGIPFSPPQGAPLYPINNQSQVSPLNNNDTHLTTSTPHTQHTIPLLPPHIHTTTKLISTPKFNTRKSTTIPKPSQQRTTKQAHILTQLQRNKRAALAKRRNTYRTKL